MLRQNRLKKAFSKNKNFSSLGHIHSFTDTELGVPVVTALAVWF